MPKKANVTCIGDRRFADGTIRAVYVDLDGRQFVADDDGEPVYGRWLFVDATEDNALATAVEKVARTLEASHGEYLSELPIKLFRPGEDEYPDVNRRRGFRIP